MTDNHPITPPTELVEQWSLSAWAMPVDEWVTDVATQAARWGSDQELEACCEWLEKDLDAYELVGLRAVYLDHNLRAARRPKPPSPKEEALQVLEALIESRRIIDPEYQALRHALEQLDD